MRFDFNLSAAFQQQVSETAKKMQEWESQTLLGEAAEQAVAQRLQFFEHTPTTRPLTYLGVDGSGDYPLLTYADSFVYLTTAHATIYGTHPLRGQGLKEQRLGESVLNLAWLPGHYEVTRTETLAAFEQMTGESVAATIEQSDYRRLKPRYLHLTTDDIISRLVIPQASESGNHAIQLRTVGELSAALRSLSGCRPDVLLYDSTLALPLYTSTASLFLEHLKRRLCVAAREGGTALIAVSKSPGLPGVEDIERLALLRAQAEVSAGLSVAEHWYLRLPIPEVDDWDFPPAEGRTVPPPGAVSYLVRFHRNTPVLRVDLDLSYWRSHLLGETPGQTREHERKLFGELDFASHDQRAYGYPYPLKAAHDRASLTSSERQAMRGQLIDAAVKAGMNRKLFRDASLQTGHR